MALLDGVTAGLNKAGMVIKQYLIIICICVFLAVAWQGWRAWCGYKDKQEAAEKAKDNEFKKQLQVLNDKAAADQKDKDALTASNVVLKNQVEMWKGKVANNPPPAPVTAPPTDVNVAVTDIASSGVRFTLTVPKPRTDPMLGSATTPTKNVPTIWTWYKESLRIPQLETAYTTQVGLTGALTKQVDGLNLEVQKGNQISTEKDAINAEHVAREANLNGLVKDADARVKRERLNGWLKTGAAFVIAYEAGKKMK